MPDLYRFAFLMTGNEEVARHVLQTSVERAARSLREVRDPHRARRWLFSQARIDCFAGRVSETAHAGASPSPQPADPAAPVPPPETPVPETVNDRPRRLALAFAVLPEPERCALTLFYLYLFSPAELAEVLDIKYRDLCALLARGRAMLQRNRALWIDLLAAPASAV